MAYGARSTWRGWVTYGRAIEPELLPALAITTVAANDEELPPGSSKFGGLPDLPEGEDWPLTEYRIPFAFLAQFNLAKVHRLLPTDDTLPTSGLLSFFYFNDYYYTFHPRQFGRLTEAGSWEPLPDGFWGEHGGGTAVGGVPLIRYIPASAPLARVAADVANGAASVGAACPSTDHYRAWLQLPNKYDHWCRTG